jgi:hypothetical protein
MIFMKRKVKEWLKRYLPAEILSVIATLATAMLVFKATNDPLSTALAGTWGGNIAYFGYILVKDILITEKKCGTAGAAYTFKHLFNNLRALVLEFGPAEVLDSFLIRPALMYYIPVWIGQLALGILIAKIAADITFYIPAIISYELRDKYLK